MKYVFVFILTILISGTALAQDRIFLRNDSVVTGELIYVDSLKVKIRMTVRPNGPDYILYKREISKIEFASGKDIFYKQRYFENSIGITGSYYNNPSVGYKDYFTYTNISSKFPGIDYQMRNAIVGLKLGVGYGQLNLVTERAFYYSINNNSNSNTSSNEKVFDITNTGKLEFTVSFRINSTVNRRLNPFISATLIMLDISMIHLVGFGLQCKINNKYFVEGEVAFGKWHGHENPKDYDTGSQLSYFNIGINRILSRKYIHGR